MMTVAWSNVSETFIRSMMYSWLSVNVEFESKSCVIGPIDNPARWIAVEKNMVGDKLKCVELKPGSWNLLVLILSGRVSFEDKDTTDKSHVQWSFTERFSYTHFTRYLKRTETLWLLSGWKIGFLLCLTRALSKC